MGKYLKCPSCFNVNPGDEVYRCCKSDCMSIFCSACKEVGFGYVCPVCGYNNWKMPEPTRLGKIIGIQNGDS